MKEDFAYWTGLAPSALEVDCWHLARTIFEDWEEDNPSQRPSNGRATMFWSACAAAEGVTYEQAVLVCVRGPVVHGDKYFRDLGLMAPKNFKDITMTIARAEVNHRIVERINELIDDAEWDLVAMHTDHKGDEA